MEVREQLHDALTGRYEIEREIGAGGMATVYLARDPRHDRNVALKVLNPELGAVLGVERFLAEIKVTANLQHPNLLPLFDSGEANGLLFYVMPFVQGESLRARLEREKQLPIDEVVRIATAVASALDYAHRHDVIHRDLKPENILLHEGQPLVADFGIALAVSKAGGNRITQTGLSLGTPHYMSPEQATGDRAIDGRTDIYSLGALTYEMLVGDPPHTGSTAQAIIAHVLTEHPRRIRATRPNVPEHVEAAVQTALEKLPADRWPTAGQFSDALQGKVVATRVGVTPVQAARSVPGGWRAQMRNPVVLTCVAITLGAVATAAQLWNAARSDPAEPVIRFPLTFPGDVTPFNPNVGPGIAVSPDGRTIAFVGPTMGIQRLHLRSLDATATRALPGTEGARLPFFSPDGRWLAFWATGRLQKIAVDGGSVLPIADVGVPYGATWSSSDRIIISDGTRLSVVAATGGSATLLVEPDSAGNELLQLWPHALPDGENVLYSSWERSEATSARIAMASLTTGKRTGLGVSGTFPLGIVDGTLVYGSAAGAVVASSFDVRRRRVAGDPVTVATDVVIGVAGATKAAMSPGGSLVFLSGSQLAHVVLTELSGTSRSVMAEPREYAYPRYSPDGKRIAITIGSGSRSDVWIYDVASGTPTRLTSDGNVNERPEWTPDGLRVLYRSDRLRRSSLWWQPADLSGPAESLLVDPLADVFEGVITRAGPSVVYQLDTAGADVMYRALSGDTAPKVIAATRFLEQRARVSPDGRWVAFTTDESGAQQVVVQPFPGPGARVQVSVDGGAEPVWAASSNRLFYRGARHFVVATYAATSTFTILSRTRLFEDSYVPGRAPHANYDVSPNGSQLLLIKAVEDPQVIVVHNWAAELRARMAGERR